MRYIISGKNINVTEPLKEAVESKLSKLERYFSPETEVHATLSVEKGRQNIEVTIPIKGTIIRAEQDSNDMYVSIDLVEEVIERQIKKYKTKIVDRKQSATAFSDLFIQEETEPEETIKIVKTKRFIGFKREIFCPLLGNDDVVVLLALLHQQVLTGNQLLATHNHIGVGNLLLVERHAATLNEFAQLALRGEDVALLGTEA